MSTPNRVMAALLLCVLVSGCMRAKFEREWRRPWSWQTTVVEDAIWTVETAALETAKILGGLAVAVVTFGLINPLEGDDDDAEEDDAAYGDTYAAPPTPTGPPPPTYRGGRQAPPPPRGRRVPGTRRQR